MRKLLKIKEISGQDDLMIDMKNGDDWFDDGDDVEDEVA